MPDLTQEGLAARGLRVKALEWFDAPNICTREKAAALGGHYSVVEFDAGTDEAHFAVNIDLGGIAFVFILEPDQLGGRRPKRYPALEAAKAAAQADYDARILAALEDTGEPALIRGSNEGPQIAGYTCRGCKHFHSEYWRESNGEGGMDSGTSATCLLLGRNITSYYGITPPPPEWCPKPRAAAAALRKDEETPK